LRNNDVYELLGNGDGTFAPAKLVIQNLTNPAVADLNHDGCPDVVDNRDPEANYPAGLAGTQFRIFLCQLDGSFTLANTYTPYTGQQTDEITLGTANGGRFPAWIGDFNGDGNIDLAAIQQATGDPTRVYYVQFLLGNGDGSFTPTYEPYFLNASRPANAFDVTGDGRADLIESDGFTSSFQVIAGATGSPFYLQLVADPVIGSQGSVQVSLAAVSSSATQVTLTGSDPAIQLPASVTIPAGSLSQNVAFTIGSSFNSTHVFWIQGTLNGSNAVAYGTQATTQGQYGVALATYWSTESTFPGLPTTDYQLGISSLAGYSTTVSFTCKGLPTGASCVFGASALSVPAGGNNSTSLMINTTASTPTGIYPITIQASDGAITSQSTITLEVGDYSISVTPNSQTALPNTTVFYTINLATTNNYGGGNFTGTCAGIPAPAVCTVSSLIATIQTTTLAAGNYNFTVNLSSGVATRSASAQLSIGDFNATLSATTLSVAVGQSGNITINVTGQNGFADAVTLSCNGAPVGTNCTVNPNPVTPSSSGTTATLTVSVTTQPAQNNSWPPLKRRTAALYLSFAGIVGVTLFLSTRPRKRQRFFRLLSLLVVLGVAASCGGGGSSGGGGGGGGGGGSGSASFSLGIQANSDGVTKNVGTLQVTIP
jgi:hypothetical protein